MDSVAAVCHTSATNVKWYVSYTQVSSYDHMTVSPDNKTLIIQRISSCNSPLQCGIEILPQIIERSEVIFPTLTYGPSSVLIRSKRRNFNGILPAEMGSQVEMECISYFRPEFKYQWIHFHCGFKYQWIHFLLNFSEKKLPSWIWSGTRWADTDIRKSNSRCPGTGLLLAKVSLSQDPCWYFSSWWQQWAVSSSVHSSFIPWSDITLPGQIGLHDHPPQT